MTVRTIFPRPWQLRAALDGRLTAVAVPIKNQTLYRDQNGGEVWTGFMGWQAIEWALETPGWCGKRCLPPFAPGDKLVVKEAWAPNAGTDGGVLYKADHGHACGFYQWDLKTGQQTKHVDHWRSPVTMPREFSRMTWEVESVDVKRVADINFDEVVALGAGYGLPGCGGAGDYRGKFAARFDEQHGPDAWERNPWIALASVVVHPRNVAQMEEDDAGAH